jgi:hypothetical protein
MSRIARAIVLALLCSTVMGISGCAHPEGWPRPWIHTWTQTYDEFPPSVNDPPQDHRQGNPSDG